MKKILLALAFLLTPSVSFAAIAATFSATSTDKGNIYPNAINGNFPGLIIGATSSPATQVNANSLLTVVKTGAVDIVASSTDNTTSSTAILEAYAPGSRVFMGAHGTNQNTSQYGIVVGGYAEIGAIDSSFGTSNGLLIGTRTTNKPIIFGNNSLERFRIDAGGNLGIATTTPTSALGIQGNVYVSGTSFFGGAITATSTFTLTAQGTGCATFTSGLLTSTGVACGSGSGGSTDKWATTTSPRDPLAIYPNGGINTLIGIGTTTPHFGLTIASTTGPQLALSDGIATDNSWTFRNAGGQLYISTSSPSTYATSSFTALTVDINGFVGIGSTSPARPFSVTGNMLLNGNYVQDTKTQSADNSIYFGSSSSGTFTFVSNNTTAGSFGENTFGSNPRMFFDTGSGLTEALSILNTNQNVGLGTTTPGTKLSLGNTGANTINISTTATSTFGSGINVLTGCFAINGTCVTGGTGSGTVNSGTIGQNAYYTGATTIGSSAFMTDRDSANWFGIGTSTPQWLLQLASSTAPQLALSDSIATDNHWTFRNAGGNLYIATSSPLTFATSTFPTVVVQPGGQSGFFSLGTTSGATLLVDTTNPTNVTLDSAAAAQTMSYFHQNTTAQNAGAFTTSALIAESNMSLTGSALNYGNLALNAIARITNTATYSTALFTAAGSYNTYYGGTGGVGNLRGIAVTPQRQSGGSGYIVNEQAIYAQNNFGVSGGVGLSGQVSAFYAGRPTAFSGSTASSTYGIFIERQDPAAGTVNSGTYGVFQQGAGDLNYFAGNAGFGTTTPHWALQASSSTAPQLTLSDGVDIDPHWSFRNTGGSLYFASSSPTTFATSTYDSLSIANTTGIVAIGPQAFGNATFDPFTASSTFGNLITGNLRLDTDAGVVSAIQLPTASSAAGTIQSLSLNLGQYSTTTLTVYGVSNGGTAGDIVNFGVGVATTSPWRTFDVNGTVGMKGLTTSAVVQQAILCVSSNNEVIAESVACVASAKRFKQNIKDLDVGLDELLKLRPVSFMWKPEYLGNKVDINTEGEQYSLVADEVQKIDPKLVSLTTQETTFEGKTYPAGTVNGLADQNHWTALFVQSIKELNAKVEAMKNGAYNDTWIKIGFLIMFLWLIYQQVTINKLKKYHA